MLLLRTKLPVHHERSKSTIVKNAGETKAWKYEETIEALRRAEQKYRSIFENATEGVFQTTPDGQYLSANPALARMYGYDSPEELLAALTDISRQLYVQAGRRAEFTLAMLQNGQVLDFESQIYRRDGTIIWISENAHVRRVICEIQDLRGASLKFLGIMTIMVIINPTKSHASTTCP